MKTREENIKFLTGHFRYNTANGWNGSTSYAVQMKIYDFVPRKLQDKAYQLLDVPDTFDAVNDRIREWDAESGHVWQAGFNGRSGGYLVLYQGGAKPSEHKSYCVECGQKNFTLTKETGKKCGACNENGRTDYKYIPLIPFSYPGKSTDQGEDFAEWDDDSIRERVKLVRRFDKLAKELQAIFLSFCEGFDVVEETIHVPKTVKRLVEKS